jgi:hypothetical protein
LSLWSCEDASVTSKPFVMDLPQIRGLEGEESGGNPDDGVNETNEIIDPREYFAAAEPEPEAPVEPPPILDLQPIQQDAVQPAQAPVSAEDLDTQIERFYQERIKPLKELCTTCAAHARVCDERCQLDKCCKDLRFSFENETLWFLLITREDYRREFLLFFKCCGSTIFSHLDPMTEINVSLMISLAVQGVPWSTIHQCFLQFGEALSFWTKYIAWKSVTRLMLL